MKDLLKKYRLALLQLQVYSDNELIIIEGTVLNIDDELKEIEENPDLGEIILNP